MLTKIEFSTKLNEWRNIPRKCYSRWIYSNTHLTSPPVYPTGIWNLICPKSNSWSSLQTLLFLQSSFQYMATPLHCLGLLYFCHDLLPIHLSMILMGIYFQNIFKNVLNAPTLLTLWSKPNSSISSHWDKCQSLLLLLFFFNPFTSQQPE